MEDTGFRGSGEFGLGDMDTEKKDCSVGEYFVKRRVLDELRLDEVAQKGTWSTKPTLGERLKESLRCSVPRLKHTLLSWIPVLSWLPHYSIRENFIGDLISGCSVGIMHLPQGLHGICPSGLLTPSVWPLHSLYPVLVYFIFGTSRHISIGTFAVISIMIGSVTERLAPDIDFPANGTNGTDLDARDAHRVEIACSLTVLTGIFQILLGVVRFGFVVTYLSEPLIRGYTTGSACHVCVSQLKYLFGVKPARFTGPLSLIYTLVDICRLLPETKVPELVVSLVALSVLIVVKEINDCYRQKLPMPIPIEIIAIIAATIIIHFADLTTKYNIDVVGEIPSGLKAPRAPDATLFSDVIGDAFAIAIELVALGLSNTVGGFFQCYSVTSSLSRSLVQESTGGKTQAVLSTIVFVNLKGMFKQFLDVSLLWKTNKVDLMVWLVTFTSTILLNLDLGLAVSVGFSMLTVIFRTQLPRYSILGHVSGTDLYLDTDTYKEAKEIPGIKIFRSSTTIYYTNAEMYLEALQEKSGIEIGKLLTAKKKQERKLKRKQEKEKNKAKKEAKKQVNEAYQHDTTMSDSDSETGDHGDNSINKVSQRGNEEKERAVRSGTHSIILDISTTSFVDTVSVKTLKNIFRDFGEIDLDVYLAGCQACVVEQLEAAGFFSESIPKSRLFVTVHDAVLHILKKLGDTDFVL
ncbi:hypothetical protein F7725_000807, partial [Dissostichus mawsoni]